MGEETTFRSGFLSVFICVHLWTTSLFSRYRSIKLATDSSSKITKRLWQAGFAMAVLVLTLAIGNAFVPREKAVTRTGMGHDFLAFYTGGVFVSQGRANELSFGAAPGDEDQTSSPVFLSNP